MGRVDKPFVRARLTLANTLILGRASSSGCTVVVQPAPTERFRRHVRVVKLAFFEKFQMWTPVEKELGDKERVIVRTVVQTSYARMRSAKILDICF